ncbi:MAG TPA: hypothetical protein PLX89_15350 [Verrucomicrobiota bacterium]|nr:hypothetical protein [Verrucomicrobiales bacterium]HRI14369.1 hypothetical protein [Verrucomicrobiota bacterium]
MKFPWLLSVALFCGLAGRVGAAESFHLFRSEDEGISWTKVGVGIPESGRIHALIALGTIAFAGTDDGVFASTDGGSSWSRRVIDPAASVQCFTVAGGRLYAGTKRAGVLVIDDDGRTWHRTSGEQTNLNVRSLVSLGSVVYAGTDSQGILRHGPGVEGWVPVNQDLPEGAQVFDLAVHGKDLFAALYSKGLYRLAANEDRWKRVGEVRPLRFWVHGHSLLAGHNPGGVYHSSDGGMTWRLANGLTDASPTWVLGSAGANVLVGTSPETVMLSGDGGVNWSTSARGLPEGSAVVAIGSGSGYTLVGVVRSSR